MKKTSVLAGSLAAAAVALFATPGFAAADPAPAAPAKPLDGKTVFLDAGSTAAPAADQAKQVANGRGGTAPCVSPAAVAANGTPDAKVNFAVAKMVEAALQSQGAKVIMSSVNDAAGGCVDQRAAAMNKSGADLALSINSAVQDAAKRGFVLETAAPGATDPGVVKAQQTVSAPAATVIRDAQRAGGFVPADYLGGKDGIAQTASALPSLVNIPLIYTNLGNLANADDAALLTSRDGQVQYAAALTNGVLQQLTGKVVPGGTVSQPVQAPVAPAADPGAIPQPVTPAAPAATAPAATAPAATAPAATVPTAPAVTVPTAPAQTPIVPAVPAVPGGNVDHPGLADRNVADRGRRPDAAGWSHAGRHPAGHRARSHRNRGAGTVGLDPRARPADSPAAAAGPGTRPEPDRVGLNSVFDMGSKASDFLTSQQGQQLVTTLMSSPQAFNSLQAAQGPAAAQEIVKSILGAGALLPK